MTHNDGRKADTRSRQVSGTILTASAALAVAILVAGCGDAALITPTTPDSTTAPVTVPATIPVTSEVPLETTIPQVAPTTVTPSPSVPLPVFPVGPDGIEYAGGVVDMERTGPDLIASGGGNVYISDPVGHRILVAGPNGVVSDIGLIERDILGVMAMTATADELVLVEVHFGPDRQRVHRLAPDGALLETIDLPAGALLEDGLSGVLVADDGRIALVLEGGARFAIVSPWSTSFEWTDVIHLGGHTLGQRGSDLSLDGQVITADLIGTLGGLSAEGVTPGGRLVLRRQEVIALDPVVDVLTSIEWYEPDGTLVGSASFPSGESVISSQPGLAVGTDGRVLVLISGEDEVRVVELHPTMPRVTAQSLGG